MITPSAKRAQDKAKRLEARCKKAREDLVARLRELTPLVVKDDGWYFRVLKEEVPVEIQPEHTETAFSYRENGRIRCKVGTYGRQKQFPERKSYESWINAIADYIVDEAKQKAAMKQAQKNKADARAAVKGVIKRLHKLGDAVQFNVTPIESGASTVEKDGEYIPREAEAITHVEVRASRYWGFDLPFDQAEEFLKEMKVLMDKYKEKE